MVESHERSVTDEVPAIDSVTRHSDRPVSETVPVVTEPATAEEAIDYFESVTLFCRASRCPWTLETSWEELEDDKLKGYAHWREAHGAPEPPLG